MAQTKKKRSKKHRGTQGGGIDQGRGGRPRSKEQAKAQARRDTQDRRNREPTWGGAFTRGLIGAAIFFVLMLVLFDNTLAQSVVLAAFMVAIYVPLGYYIDRFFWRRRMNALAKQRAEAKQQQGRRR
ncbi:MAG: hypothetical protein H0W09_03785 [Solirubrobacterales bacterium]|nr:hypothetical protein [Solirubrobacterales bacterium]